MPLHIREEVVEDETARRGGGAGESGRSQTGVRLVSGEVSGNRPACQWDDDKKQLKSVTEMRSVDDGEDALIGAITA